MRWFILIATAIVILGAFGCENSENKIKPIPSSGDVDSDSDTNADSDVDSETDSDTDSNTSIQGTCDDYLDTPGSVGCNFLVPTVPFLGNDTPDVIVNGACYNGACFAVMISNNTNKHVKLELSRGDTVYNAMEHTYIPSGLGDNLTSKIVSSDGIPPNQVAILFLSHQDGAKNTSYPLTCPKDVNPAEIVNTAAIGSDKGVAFELKSDWPISLYDIMPYGGAKTVLPSASLLIPYTSWGTNYVAIVPHEGKKGWILAIASENNTTLNILTDKTSQSSNSITVPTPGKNQKYTLDKGEYIQLIHSNRGNFEGTILQSDKAIGVYTGETLLRVETEDSPTGGGQDSTHQQINHIQALSSEYLGVGIPSRLKDGSHESVLYRITGIVEDTTLTWSPSKPDGAPSSLDLGDVVEFETRDYFTVASKDDQHPFSMTQYQSGYIKANNAGGCFNTDYDCYLGDEDWINLVPPVQFINQYAFFTDPTYGVTSVSVIRVAVDDLFSDVEILCLGKVSGWEPVGSDGKYEVAQVHLYRGGVGITSQCETSQHSATSDNPFGLIVWGVDRAASYGYAAGGSIKKINDVEIIIIE